MAGTSPAMTIQTNLILLESSKPFGSEIARLKIDGAFDADGIVIFR
jgi:hypothetical protein